MRIDHDDDVPGLLLSAVDAGVLNECRQRKLRYGSVAHVIGNVYREREPVTVSVLLELQVILDEAHFLMERDDVLVPLDDVTLECCKTFDHGSGLRFALDYAVHPDVLKAVEQEVRVDLHTHREKFRLLLLDLRLLIDELVLINGLDELSVPSNKFVVTVHEMGYLVGTFDVADRHESYVLIALLENLVELPEPARKRLVYEPHQEQRDEDV